MPNDVALVHSRSYVDMLSYVCYYCTLVSLLLKVRACIKDGMTACGITCLSDATPSCICILHNFFYFLTK